MSRLSHQIVIPCPDLPNHSANYQFMSGSVNCGFLTTVKEVKRGRFILLNSAAFIWKEYQTGTAPQQTSLGAALRGSSRSKEMFPEAVCHPKYELR